MKIKNIEVHKSITTDRLMEAVEAQMMSLDNPGFCILCGCEHEGVEPDARDYKCESCGGPFVYGAEELLMRIAL